MQGAAVLRLAAAVGLCAAIAACFNGSDAAGLPCELDRDCGVDQRCLSGVCTNRTDDTPPETCGNGVLNMSAGEQCDDGNDIDDDGCTNACTLPACGDGIVQAQNGEECDDGNIQDDGTCLADCTFVWFFDDAEDAAAFATWTQAPLDGNDPKTAWTRVTTMTHGGRGAYHLPPQDDGVAAGAGLRFVSPPIDLSNPDPGTGGVELRFFHQYDFTTCVGQKAYDGGLLQVSTDGGNTWTTVAPVDGYPDTVAPKDMNDPNDPPTTTNPLGVGVPVFGGENTTWTEVRVDLSDFAGETIHLAFVAGFDDFNCSMGNADPALLWLVDDLVVARPKN